MFLIPSHYGNYTDFGTDPCVRNSTEAYLCYSNYLNSVYYQIGWPQQLVQKLVSKAQPFSTGRSAADFWKQTQGSFFSWIKEAGYSPSDLPKLDKVGDVLESYSQGAFSWDDLQKELKKGFSPPSLFNPKKWWEKQPRGTKIAIIGGASLIGLYYISSLLGSAAQITQAIKSK